MSGGPLPEAEAVKVRVHFKAVAGAPILKKNKFLIPASEPFGTVIKFLRAQLRLGEGASLFLYCNSAFSPSPEDPVLDLFECFKVGGELVLNYSVTEAWG